MRYLFDRFTLYAQAVLWFIGIAIHNLYRDECTPDFNCCVNCGRYRFIAIMNRKYKAGLVETQRKITQCQK